MLTQHADRAASRGEGHSPTRFGGSKLYLKAGNDIIQEDRAVVLKRGKIHMAEKSLWNVHWEFMEVPVAEGIEISVIPDDREMPQEGFHKITLPHDCRKGLPERGSSFDFSEFQFFKEREKG